MAITIREHASYRATDDDLADPVVWGRLFRTSDSSAAWHSASIGRLLPVPLDSLGATVVGEQNMCDEGITLDRRWCDVRSWMKYQESRWLESGGALQPSSRLLLRDHDLSARDAAVRYQERLVLSIEMRTRAHQAPPLIVERAIAFRELMMSYGSTGVSHIEVIYGGVETGNHITEIHYQDLRAFAQHYPAAQLDPEFQRLAPFLGSDSPPPQMTSLRSEHVFGPERREERQAAGLWGTW